MLSRSFGALPVNRAALSFWAKSGEAPAENKPHIITKDIPFLIIKAPNLRRP